MRKLGMCFFAALSLTASLSPAQASQQGPGKVSLVHVMNNGVVIFILSGNRTAQPSCSTQQRWAFNSTTAAGQAKLSLLLTAYSSGKILVVYGTATCPDWGDSETVEYFRTAD
jgi:hypothetical protein